MSRVVLTYGTFDLFHIGHLRLLERAKALGDELLVGVSTDEFNAIKNKRSTIPFEHRRQIVQAMRCVTLAFPEKSWAQKEADIAKYKVDVFVMGDDWEGKFDSLKERCEVVYLPRTQDISSTLLNSTLDGAARDVLTAVTAEHT
jgi:glycerol-3-phosphate cytidylyltransferase